MNRTNESKASGGNAVRTWTGRASRALSAIFLAAGLAACGGGGDATATLESPQATVALATAAPVTGAIFTTDMACTGTDLNIYLDKGDVYLDGGPRKVGSAGLPEGNYWVQVTDPSGATVLGTSLTNLVVVTAAGEFATCYQLADIVYSGSSGFTTKGYDDTPNAGGEYKVWISTVMTFDNDQTKTDNFKVRQRGDCPEGQVRDESGNCVEISPNGTLVVKKFYDANANGVYDNTDQYIEGWKVAISEVSPDPYYTTATVVVAAGDYTVSEFMPVETNWSATTASPVVAAVPAGGTTTVEFGNLCTGAGGGLTLGFWSNKNGQALFGADDLALMISLNLRNASGTEFNPGSYAAFKSWLLSATATNMAYMLSAQLAAMELNVYNGKVTGGSLIYAPGTTSANALGYATVTAVMAEANTELGLHGNTTSGTPGAAFRSYQESLKNALDNANNNKTFVQATPCAFTFN